jgi:hypothetical protein
LSNEDGKQRVVIAVDPHKASWTAAAVDESLQPLASIRVPVSREGYRTLRRFARTWKATMWAIEGATGLGSTLTARLADDEVAAVRPSSLPGSGCSPLGMAVKTTTLMPYLSGSLR